MAQADLECYDENGNVTLSASTLFGRVLGSVNTGLANGSAYFPGLTTSGAEHWYMCSVVGAPNLNCLPRVTIANDSVRWEFVDFTISGTPVPRLGLNIIVGTD